MWKEDGSVPPSLLMKPTPEQLQRLREDQDLGDSEGYHSTFDKLIEERLMELDPEWMDAMAKEYADSRMSRWYA